MKTRMIEQREGENCGPIDWEHPLAKAKPAIWREAEKDPDKFVYHDKMLLAVAMYDGWPYWTPRPAIQYIGPLGTAEWTYFDSYGVHDDSIRRRTSGAQ